MQGQVLSGRSGARRPAYRLGIHTKYRVERCHDVRIRDVATVDRGVVTGTILRVDQRVIRFIDDWIIAPVGAQHERDVRELRIDQSGVSGFLEVGAAPGRAVDRVALVAFGFLASPRFGM